MEYYKDDLATLYCGDCIDEMNKLIENNIKIDKNNKDLNINKNKNTNKNLNLKTFNGNIIIVFL